MNKKTTKTDNEHLKEILNYISERCREESDEANGLKSNYDEDQDYYNEALATFFEKMADIIDEAISEVD